MRRSFYKNKKEPSGGDIITRRILAAELITTNNRVNRSGEHTDISQRLISRIVSTTLELSNTGCCEHCNAPLFKSKKDNLVCSEICWSK